MTGLSHSPVRSGVWPLWPLWRLAARESRSEVCTRDRERERERERGRKRERERETGENFGSSLAKWGPPPCAPRGLSQSRGRCQTSEPPLLRILANTSPPWGACNNTDGMTASWKVKATTRSGAKTVENRDLAGAKTVTSRDQTGRVRLSQNAKCKQITGSVIAIRCKHAGAQTRERQMLWSGVVHGCGPVSANVGVDCFVGRGFA